MYPFDMKLETTKKSSGTNKIKGIVVHHTAGWTFVSNMRYLSSSPAQASVHFVIWENEERWKIWDPTDILRHAGNWKRGNCKNCNTDFLGIEVVWFWEYNQKQFIALTDLVEYLMGVYNIPKEMIIRHSDCTQSDNITKAKILWNWTRTSKKKDIWLNFFPMWFETWRNQLSPRTQSRYG